MKPRNNKIMQTVKNHMTDLGELSLDIYRYKHWTNIELEKAWKQ